MHRANPTTHTCCRTVASPYMMYLERPPLTSYVLRTTFRVYSCPPRALCLPSYLVAPFAIHLFAFRRVVYLAATRTTPCSMF